MYLCTYCCSEFFRRTSTLPFRCSPSTSTSPFHHLFPPHLFFFFFYELLYSLAFDVGLFNHVCQLF